MEKTTRIDLNSQPSRILLFDSSSNISELKKFIDKQSTKIITFDYESHAQLENERIEHEISDNYIDESDLQLVQEESYSLTEWFNEPALKNLVEYENINLGKLFHVEFTYFLIKFLKRFLEINQIFNKYGETKLVASPSMYDLAYSIYPQTIKLIGTHEKFQQDSIKISSTIARKTLTINLPRSYYVFLKEVSEKICNFFFNPKPDTNEKKTVMFVEFDVIKFRQMFSLLPQNQINPILFNRRRPSIWNLDSFSVVKKSGTRIVIPSALLDSKTKALILNQTEQFQTNIDSLLMFDSFFEKFFSINNISFWQIIKPKFIKLLKKRITDYIQEIILTKRLLQRYSFSSVVVWSEVGVTEQIVIKLAKSLKIPSLLVQHGIFYDSDEAYKMNKFQGVYPSEVDKYVVWGTLESANALKHGVNAEKIVVLGSPQYDHLAYKKNENSESDLILIATSGFNKEDIRGLTVSVHKKYLETLKKICVIIAKHHKKVIIKLHPSPDELDIDELTKTLDGDVQIIKSGNISHLIKSCNVMIMIDLSSVMLEAQIFGKPVISISLKNWWGVPTIFSSQSCQSIGIDEFDQVLKRMLFDKNFRQDLIYKGDAYSHQYISNLGQASKNLLQLLSNL